MIATRPANAADTEFIERTFLVTLREAISMARGSWDEVRERRQFQDQLRLQHTAIVQSDGFDVGFVIVVPVTGGLELHTLCITPQFQCKGIGSAVTARIVLGARQRELDVVVYVLKANVRARSFYERLDFVAVGESEHHHKFRHVSGALAA